MLLAALREAGAAAGVSDLGVAPDTPQGLEALLDRTIEDVSYRPFPY
jgi:hypothetical protein